MNGFAMWENLRLGCGSLGGERAAAFVPGSIIVRRQPF
jgi:hypothetical protein